MTVDVAEGIASITTTDAAPFVKISKLQQGALTLSPGTYTLTFDCYSTMDRVINILIRRNIGTTPLIMLEQNDVAVTTTLATYSYEFIVEAEPRLSQKDELEISIGKYEDTIIFDNFIIAKK